MPSDDATAPAATIVIPAYNESHALPFVLAALEPVARRGRYEVLVVDDGSTDDPARIVRRTTFARLVRHERNRGKGAAMRTGIDASRGDLIVFMDADNTYPVDAIPGMLACLAHRDVVFGVRTWGKDNIPAINRLGNRALARLISAVSGRQLRDPLTGLYATHKRHLADMRLASDGFAIEAEINIKASRMGLEMCEHPVSYAPRIGQTKLHPVRDGLRIVRTVARHGRAPARPDLRRAVLEPCGFALDSLYRSGMSALHAIGEEPLAIVTEPEPLPVNPAD